METVRRKKQQNTIQFVEDITHH